MTAMAHEPMPTQDNTLLDGFLALETPTGFRAELIEGEIVVSTAAGWRSRGLSEHRQPAGATGVGDRHGMVRS